MTNIDFKLIANNLELVDGTWVSTNRSDISYPDEGNELFSQLEEDSFWFRHRNHCIIEMVKQFPPRGPLFDVGGGNGFVAKALEDNGIWTVLVEPGEKGVENAKKRELTHIIRSTLEDAGFKPHTLPGVGLFDVLEHIRDPPSFLAALHQLLEPGGRLYITVPAFKFLWSKDDDFAGHFQRYTVKRLRKLLKEHGFYVDYATYIFFILPLPIFLFRSLPAKLGLVKHANSVQRHQKSHSRKPGIASKLLEKMWAMELNRIKYKKVIPVGSSCLIAAVNHETAPIKLTSKRKQDEQRRY